MNKKAKPLYALAKKIEVEWVDSVSSKGWGDRNHHLNDFAESNCRTAGYLIERTKKAISIAQSLSDSTRHLADVISIPVVAVTKIKILK